MAVTLTGIVATAVISTRLVGDAAAVDSGCMAVARAGVGATDAVGEGKTTGAGITPHAFISHDSIAKAIPASTGERRLLIPEGFDWFQASRTVRWIDAKKKADSRREEGRQQNRVGTYDRREVVSRRRGNAAHHE